MLALLDGHLHEAVELIETSVARAEDVGRPDFARLIARRRLVLPLLYLGEPERLLGLVSGDAFNTRKPPQEREMLLIAAVCLSQLGRFDEARRLAEPLLDRDLDEASIDELQLRLQLAVLWEDRVAAAHLAERLAPVAHVSYTIAGCVGRLLGASWAMRGDVVRARAAFDLAVNVCERSRFRPELGLARLDLAELLLEHYPQERAAALDHLDIATAEFRAMGMQPYSSARSPLFDPSRRMDSPSANAKWPHCSPQA